MKKILALIVLSIAMVSCYEEYIVDYPYTAVYFYLQQDVRTFVIGEGMKFKVGVTMGGVSDNTMTRNVGFTLDNSLITPARLAGMKLASQGYIKNAVTPVAAFELLPTTHYTLSNSSTMVIPSGWYTGLIDVKADSVAFLNDSVKTKVSTYVLPFKITSADADSVLPLKNYNVVGTMYENMLFGNYWHGGSALINRPAKTDTTIKYYTTVPVAENRIWTLTTVSPQVLSCNGYYSATVTAAANHMTFVLKGNKIILSDGTTTVQNFTPEGECTFNNARLLQNRKIFLKYKYTDAVSGYTYHCTDTLTFRNRVRDGTNEWQDENPGHYTK
ncbi:MAG: DUF1735 domain-containing protein [Bacteroidia bacterium]|nr:DUF1735 domain-containing protein [Bacteroidia bacterium]